MTKNSTPIFKPERGDRILTVLKTLPPEPRKKLGPEFYKRRKKPARKAEVTKRCEHCGQDFRSWASANRRFCSTTCMGRERTRRKFDPDRERARKQQKEKSNKDYYHQNKEELLAKSKEWAQEHKERRRQIALRSYHKRKGLKKPA